MQILFVLPDYFEQYPKPCYGGWGKLYLVVAPDGKVLPCHGATQITTLAWPNARDHSLDWIWQESSGVQRLPGRRLDAGALPDLPAGRRSISAAAAARRSRSPGTPRTPTPSAS